MDSTKLQICNIAKNLFNERGYRSVSMRDIAAASGVSLGTLTYHFARKEDLLTTIMDVNIHNFPETPPENIAGLHQLLGQMLVSIEEAPFYFNDYSVCTALPALKEQHHNHVGQLFALMEHTLSRLTECGLLSAALTQAQRQSLTRLLLFSHTGWSQYNHTRDTKKQIPLNEILDAQWVALVPYLTPEGFKQYEKLQHR